MTTFYRQMTPEQALMLLANPQAVAFVKAQNQRTQRQAYDEWLASLAPNLQDSEADRLASQEYSDYFANVANPEIEDVLARSTHGALGGTTNTFAADRESRLRAQAQKEAESIKVAKKNEELARIEVERNKLEKPYYTDFASSLGAFAPYANSYNKIYDNPGGMTMASMNTFVSPHTPTDSVRSFGVSPEFEAQPSVTPGYSPLQAQASREAGTTSKLARAGAGLYDLVTKMQRQGQGFKDVGRQAGSMLSGIFHAPGNLIGGLKEGYSNSF